MWIHIIKSYCKNEEISFNLDCLSVSGSVLDTADDFYEDIKMERTLVNLCFILSSAK